MKMKLLLVVLIGIVAYFMQGFIRPEMAYYWAVASNYYWANYALFTWLIMFIVGSTVTLKLNSLYNKLTCKPVPQPKVQPKAKAKVAEVVEVVEAEVVYKPQRLLDVQKIKNALR